MLRALSPESFGYKSRSASKLTAITTAFLIALGNVIGCRNENGTQGTAEVQVSYRAVQNPVSEMCTDDSESRTEYFNVPLVRFDGPRISLNGRPTSASELLAWAQAKYTNLPEQAVSVQFSPDNKVNADNVLLPIAEALPRLQLRRADFTFRCPKLPTPR